MSERPVQLQAILTQVRRRWVQRSLLRAWTLGATVAATIAFVGVGATLLVAREGLPLMFTASVVLLAAIASVVWTLWPCRHAPSDRQIARLIEERNPDLDDVVVTAVDYASRPDASLRMMRALAARCRARVGYFRCRRHRFAPSPFATPSCGRRAATVGLVIAAALFGPTFSRATNVASAYLFPARLTVEVTPGTTKVQDGAPVTISARIHGLVGELVPALTVAVGNDTRMVRMVAGSRARNVRRDD